MENTVAAASLPVITDIRTLATVDLGAVALPSGFTVSDVSTVELDLNQDGTITAVLALTQGGGG